MNGKIKQDLLLFFISAIIICSCSQLTKKEKPFNEYLLGTWGIRKPMESEERSINKIDLEFTDKKVYISTSWSEKDYDVNTIPCDYVLDGKRIIIKDFTDNREKVLLFSSIDSSLSFHIGMSPANEDEKEAVSFFANLKFYKKE